jgi:hypothetical protein
MPQAGFWNRRRRRIRRRNDSDDSGEEDDSPRGPPFFTCNEKGNSLFVDAIYGDDHEGERENPCKPFATLSGARSSAKNGDTIFVRPGTYKENKSIGARGDSLTEVNWFFETGASVEFTGTLFSISQGFTTQVAGDGKFSSTDPEAVFVNNQGGNIVIDGENLNIAANAAISIAGRTEFRIVNVNGSPQSPVPLFTQSTTNTNLLGVTGNIYTGNKLFFCTNGQLSVNVAIINCATVLETPKESTARSRIQVFDLTTSSTALVVKGSPQVAFANATASAGVKQYIDYQATPTSEITPQAFLSLGTVVVNGQMFSASGDGRLDIDADNVVSGAIGTTTPENKALVSLNLDQVFAGAPTILGHQGGNLGFYNEKLISAGSVVSSGYLNFRSSSITSIAPRTVLNLAGRSNVSVDRLEGFAPQPKSLVKISGSERVDLNIRDLVPAPLDAQGNPRQPAAEKGVAINGAAKARVSIQSAVLPGTIVEANVDKKSDVTIVGDLFSSSTRALHLRGSVCTDIRKVQSQGNTVYSENATNVSSSLVFGTVSTKSSKDYAVRIKSGRAQLSATKIVAEKALQILGGNVFLNIDRIVDNKSKGEEALVDASGGKVSGKITTLSRASDNVLSLACSEATLSCETLSCGSSEQSRALARIACPGKLSVDTVQDESKKGIVISSGRFDVKARKVACKSVAFDVQGTDTKSVLDVDEICSEELGVKTSAKYTLIKTNAATKGSCVTLTGNPVVTLSGNFLSSTGKAVTGSLGTGLLNTIGVCTLIGGVDTASSGKSKKYQNFGPVTGTNLSSSKWKNSALVTSISKVTPNPVDPYTVLPASCVPESEQDNEEEQEDGGDVDAGEDIDEEAGDVIDDDEDGEQADADDGGDLEQAE